MRKETDKQVSKTDNKPISGNLIGDARRLIQTARQNVAVTVNAGFTILYWQIGSRIRQEDKLTPDLTLYGQDSNGTVWSICNMNMTLDKFLKGLGYSEEGL